MSKHNYFVIFFKKINLSITNILEKFLNKLNVKNLYKKELNFISINRVLLSLLIFVILFLAYVSIPHIHDKTKIKAELKNQLLDKFNTDFVFSKKFNYKFLPRPHFIIQDSVILKDHTKISGVKTLKIYVSLSNLFSLINIKVKDIIIENANFNIDNQNYDFFVKLLDNNFSESNFKIKDSNIFYQDSEKEVLFIIKIKEMKYYFDSNNLQNIIFSKNEIFNIPYTYELTHDKIKNRINSKLNLNFLKLQIDNEFYYVNNIKKGSTDIIFNKNKSMATYEINDNSFIFKFFEKLNNPKFIYRGKLNLNPFYSNLTGETDKFDLDILFDINSLLAQLLKTEIFNNENLNIDLSVKAKKIYRNSNFINLILNSRINQGSLDIDNTKLNWKNFADFEIFDSLIYVSENQLILGGKLIINIKESNKIYKYLLTPKNSRSKIKKIEVKFNYNVDQKVMSLKDIKIDNQVNQNVNEVLKNLKFKNDKHKNRIYFKNIINKALKSHEG